jgi:hypothetical protein
MGSWCKGHDFINNPFSTKHLRNLISIKLIDEFATNGNDVCPSPTKYISDRRAHVRRRTGSPAYIELGEGNRALVLSISEGGLGPCGSSSDRGSHSKNAFPVARI